MVRSWTVADFALAWLAGYLGEAVFIALGTPFAGGDLLVGMAIGGHYVFTLGVLWLIKSRRNKPDLGLSVEPRDILFVGVGALLQVVFALLMSPLARFLFPDGEPTQQVIDAIADPGASLALKIGLFSAAVFLAPVAEELTFRGVLLQALKGTGQRLAILGTALAFSAVHFLGLNTDRLLASAAVVLPPILLLGALLAWLTLRTGRLGPAIFVHSGWNLLAAVVLLLPPEILEQVGTTPQG